MRTLAGTVVFTLLLAGCIDPGAGVQEEQDDQARAPTAPEPVDASLTGCVETGAARFVSFEHLESILPPGYVPGDGSEFFGMPVPVDKGVVLAGHLDCEDSVVDGGPVQWSDLIVYVHPPDVPGVESSDDRMDLYQLAQYSSGEATIAMLQEVGFHAFHAEITRTELVTPAPLGGASTVVGGQDLFSFEVASAAPAPYELYARFWHETPDGTAYFEHERASSTSYIGTMTQCRAASGSAFAEAFGVTDCTGPDGLGGLFPEPTDFQSTFYYLPGVKAIPPG